MNVQAGRYSGVLFDLDDTLLDHRGAAQDALVGWAAHAGVSIAADDLVALWQVLERRYYDMYQRGELTKTEQRRERVRAVLAPATVTDDEADGLFVAYWEFYRSAWRTFPDAADAVRRALACGLQVGLLTNGDVRDQRRKVEATELIEFGLPLFASSELPAAKPDPRAFEFACTAMAVTPDRCLMVGDSLVNDIHGALGAGLPAVLLDRSGAAGAAPEEFGLVRSLDDVRFH